MRLGNGRGAAFRRGDNASPWTPRHPIPTPRRWRPRKAQSNAARPRRPKSIPLAWRGHAICARRQAPSANVRCAAVRAGDGRRADL